MAQVIFLCAHACARLPGLLAQTSKKFNAMKCIEAENRFCFFFDKFSLSPAGWSGVMLAGGVAGVVAWSFGTPMDVIKARLQVDGALGTQRYRGFFHCVTDTVRTEGVGVFFRSWGINCLRAVPVSTAVFLTYEVFTGLLKTRPDSVEPPRVGFE